MPQTVPNRPMNGAVEPTEASRVRPLSRRCDTRFICWRSVRVTSSPMSTLAARVLPLALTLTASSAWVASGAYTCSLSACSSRLIASFMVGASQKFSNTSALWRMRHEIQALDRM